MPILVQAEPYCTCVLPAALAAAAAIAIELRCQLDVDHGPAPDHLARVLTETWSCSVTWRDDGTLIPLRAVPDKPVCREVLPVELCAELGIAAGALSCSIEARHRGGCVSLGTTGRDTAVSVSWWPRRSWDEPFQPVRKIEEAAP